MERETERPSPQASRYNSTLLSITIMKTPSLQYTRGRESELYVVTRRVKTKLRRVQTKLHIEDDLLPERLENLAELLPIQEFSLNSSGRLKLPFKKLFVELLCYITNMHVTRINCLN